MNIRAQSVATEGDAALLAVLKTLEPELKRALYNGFERVQATKAALYLAVSHRDGQTLRVATSYAFDTGGREVIDGRDAVVARLTATGRPIIVNGIGSELALTEVLFRHNHQRMLIVPIFGRGRRLVGIVDLRDKAAKKPFEEKDIALAQTVADDIVAVLASKQLYGVGGVTAGATPIAAAMSIAAAMPAFGAQPKLPVARRSGAVRALNAAMQSGAFSPVAGVSPRAQGIIRAARERMQRRGVNAGDARRRIPTAEDMERLRVFLPAALAYPAVVAAALTSVAKPGVQCVVSQGALSRDAQAAMDRQLAASLQRPENEVLAVQAVLWNVAESAPAITAARIRTVACTPIATRTFEGLIFSAAFETNPDDDVRQRVRGFASAFSEAIAGLMGRGEWAAQRLAVAERLVEPDFQRLRGLGDHCRLVSALSARFAMALKQPPDVVETIRIAALVHDVGLRLLDYENIVGVRKLTMEQMEAVREHPLVGAAIVEPLLGADVAEILLRHHEQHDGKGYPSGLAGARIPLGSRIVAISDAWGSMTSPWTYASAALSERDAIARLRDCAGTQFDPQLVSTFLTSLREIV